MGKSNRNCGFQIETLRYRRVCDQVGGQQVSKSMSQQPAELFTSPGCSIPIFVYQFTMLPFREPRCLSKRFGCLKYINIFVCNVLSASVGRPIPMQYEMFSQNILDLQFCDVAICFTNSDIILLLIIHYIPLYPHYISIQLPKKIISDNLL